MLTWIKRFKIRNLRVEILGVVEKENSMGKQVAHTTKLAKKVECPLFFSNMQVKRT
jgi:hypothetical protein